MKTFLSILLLMSLSGCKSTANLEVVSNFDVSRYMGVWYEIARFPHRLEKGLSAVTAEYALNGDGTIKVLNRGYNDKRKEWTTIEGVAKSKGPVDQGWLKVSFFKPFYASYKIVHLDEDYTKAIVAGPSYGYLWVLARDPSLPEAELDQLVDQVRKLGFDTKELILVDQSKSKS